MKAACLSFLRELDKHALLRLDGTDSAHARECSSCERRVRVAASLISLLRERPVSPPALRKSKLLDGAYERAIHEFESSELGAALGSFVRVPADDMSPVLWPVQTAARGLAAQLREPQRSPPWLWQSTLDRVRSELRARVQRRTSSTRPWLYLAAAVLLGLGFWAQAGAGVPEELRIEVVTVSGVPGGQAALSGVHWVAAMRSGAVR